MRRKNETQTISFPAPQSSRLYDSKEASRYEKGGFLMAPPSMAQNDDQRELMGEYEYFGSVTSRPLSKSQKKNVSDNFSEFSIFHNQYDTNHGKTSQKDQYDYSNSENAKKVQAIRAKQRMEPIRPFLYIQEEGEIVKIKMVGKRWIMVGSKKVDSQFATGRVTVWERQ